MILSNFNLLNIFIGSNHIQDSLDMTRTTTNTLNNWRKSSQHLLIIIIIIILFLLFKKEDGDVLRGEDYEGGKRERRGVKRLIFKALQK
jgi:hypothetical protein